ncbi:transcriptional regulator ATRX homolog [Acropora muricata]|uniref:transcriptional regulator ATRX homolog n=1 Tax=Acropora muricata TaxID=159855 RepID=UPI0034E4DE6D
MRRSIKKTERKSKSSKRKEKHKDEGTVSAEFDDENTDELTVQTVQSNAHEEDMKTASDRSTPVIPEKFPEDRKVVSADDEAVDDSPEDVSWKVGKETAIQERAREKEAQMDKKRKEKQVRIERNERLREQKERKREREYSRLPVEVLQQVAKQQESQKLEDETRTDRKGGDHVTFASSSEEEDDEDANTEENLAVKVVVIPKEIRKPKKIQQSANSFLQEHLFGDRLQRISAISDLDRSKKKDVYEPASKFCKKSSLC